MGLMMFLSSLLEVIGSLIYGVSQALVYLFMFVAAAVILTPKGRMLGGMIYTLAEMHFAKRVAARQEPMEAYIMEGTSILCTPFVFNGTHYNFMAPIDTSKIEDRCIITGIKGEDIRDLRYLPGLPFMVTARGLGLDSIAVDTDEVRQFTGDDEVSTSSV